MRNKDKKVGNGRSPSPRIVQNDLVSQGDVLGSLVRFHPEEPPHAHKKRQTTSDQAGIIHRSGISRQSIGEAEDDNEGKDVDARKSVDNETNEALHPEEAGLERRPTGENVGKDGGKVGKTGELHEGANEGVECGRRAHVDTREDGDYDAADQGCVEWVVHLAVDTAEPFREGGGSVASKGPEGTAGGDIAAAASDEGRQESDD